MKKRYLNKHSINNKLLRFTWNFVWLFFFRPTPRWCLNNWRVFLLRLFGAEIGRSSRVLPDCKVWAPWNLKMGSGTVLAEGVNCYNISPVQIDDFVTISQGSFLCTASHDISKLNLPLTYKPITIGKYCWVCADCFIGPGVSIGNGSVIGARTVLTSSVGEWLIVSEDVKLKSRKRNLSS